MPFDWSSAAVGDFVDLQRGNTYQSALLDKPGPVLLGLASIERDGGFRSDKLRTYGGESPDKLLVYPGDIYVSLKDVTQSGDLLGSVARVPSFIAVGRMTQDTVKLVFKSELINRSYLYWVLRTPEYREYCRARGMGTTNLSLSRDDFLSFPVPKPTPARLSIQRTLDAIEGKITLNRDICQTLEAMAQAIFKSWFVDFDPVKAKIAAKAEGRDPLRAAMSAISGKADTELDTLLPEAFEQLAATAALFPDEMQESELGKVPRGWEAKSLDSVANYLNGLALQKFPPKSATDFLPVIKIAQLRAGHTEGADKAASDLKLEYVVCDGDVLFSWSGSLEADVWTGGRGALNQHLFKVTSSTVPKWFYLWATKYHLPEFREIAANKATTMGHIQRKHLSDARTATPPTEFLSQASKVLAPLLDEIVSLRLQSRELAKARDTLLPKLLSGELPVDALIESAGAA